MKLILLLLLLSSTVERSVGWIPPSKLIKKQIFSPLKLPKHAAPKGICFRIGILRAVNLEEKFDTLLNDIMYSGDTETLLVRNSKVVYQEDFLKFVEQKISTIDDSDEIEVMNEIIFNLKSKLTVTKGNKNEELVYEERLDNIVFTAPKLRRQYIIDHKEEMTEAFIAHVRKIYQEQDDEDNKVALATILRMIEEVALNTGSNLDHGHIIEDNFYKFGDEEEFSSLEKLAAVGNKNEQMLAGFMFSTNDLVDDILNNLHLIDDSFISYLEHKIDKCEDLEERGALKSLLTTIEKIKEKVKMIEGELEEDEEFGADVSMEEIASRMRDIQLGEKVLGTDKKKEEKASFTVFEDKEKTFQSILSRFRNIPADKKLSDVVIENYDLCDYEFMESLGKRAAQHEENMEHEEAEFLKHLITEINIAMTNKVETAYSKLERILSKKDMVLIEAEAALLARKGEADEALVLLIEANAQEAKKAGAIPAYEMLTKIAKRIVMEQERKLPDEQQLLRSLLRLDSSEKRKGVLYDAFKPRKVMNENSEVIEQPPLIVPPVFINLVRSFIQNFGNVDGFKIMNRAMEIVDEAQIVATELYGEGLTPQQQQKLMFEKNTISVWDLGNYEEQALLTGEDIPWENGAFDNKGPEDVLGERVQKIGGLDGL